MHKKFKSTPFSLPLYKLISTVRSDTVAQNPNLVLGLLLFCTTLCTVTVTALFVVSYVLAPNNFIAVRIILNLAAITYLAVMGFLLYKSRTKAVSVMLLVYYAAASAVLLLTPIFSVSMGFVLLGFCIVLAGLTLGPKYCVPVFLICSMLLFVFKVLFWANIVGISTPLSLINTSYSDIFGVIVIYLFLALISWISGSQLASSLQKAQESKDALQREKVLLSKRLEARTRKLQAAQLKEMQQLYRFAELGQFSTALFHELANHLTVLTLDIEDIGKLQHSKAIERATRSICYLDDIVEQVRSQLGGSNKVRTFNVVLKVQETIAALKDAAHKNNVHIKVSFLGNKSSFKLFGDPVSFRQILTIVVSNAIDSYGLKSTNTKNEVLITVSKSKSNIIVLVTDYGPGISKQARGRLFTPFYTTKQNGMGIGLFIAKKLLKTHFKGTIALTEHKNTTFKISVPLGKTTS